MLRVAIPALLVVFAGSSAWAQAENAGDPADPQPQVQGQAEQQPPSDKSADKGQDNPKPDEHPNALTDPRDRIYYPGDTESGKQLGQKLFWNILYDQKEIWTSPFHMHKDSAPFWIGFGAATGALIATDHKSANALANSRGQVNWSNSVSNIGAAYTVIPILAGFYGFGVFNEDAKAREVGVLGTESLVDALVVSEVIKSVTRRNRPDALQSPGKWWGGGDGFPSGHTIEVWSVASLISYEYGHTKYVPIIADSLAGIVTVARFTSRRHYASDILAGGGMGWFIGRYVWKTHQDHSIHPHGRSVAVLPQFDPLTRSYGVSVAVAP